jgi:hypothetical protein
VESTFIETKLAASKNVNMRDTRSTKSFDLIFMIYPVLIILNFYLLAICYYVPNYILRKLGHLNTQKNQDSVVRSCSTSSDLWESSSLETVVMEGSSTSDDFLTFGDFVSDFTFSLLSSTGISSFVSTCTSPSGVGTVVTESKSVVFAEFDVDVEPLSLLL